MAPPPDEMTVAEIRSSLTCSKGFASVLAQRGGSEWARLIDPDRSRFHDPALLPDMETAISRVLDAVRSQERVYIHGDFDVDGLSAASVLFLGLQPLFPQGGLKVEVGDRRTGHGVSRAFVRRAIEERFSLIITADCGISNHDEIAQLAAAGIDTIVSDHHIPMMPLPPALAVINPLREDSTYPNRYLAGVGVAFKLVQALYQRTDRPAPFHLLDLVALGTVADLVPLAYDSEIENRALVREGFKLIAEQQGSSNGLQVLMESLSLKPDRLTASDIAFYIAPKLNAANRTGDPKVAFLLLTTRRRDRASYLAEVLLDYNRDREIAQQDLLSQARARLGELDTDPRGDGILILDGKNWNEGILGLTASNLIDQFGVPTIIVSHGDRISRASCRSVRGFDMVACLETHADLLLHYGGHQMAAGFSLVPENLPELRRRLIEYAADHAPENDRSTQGRIDTHVEANEINHRFHTNIRSLAPFGVGNPAPLLLLEHCSFADLTLVGARRQHLKGTAVQGGDRLPFIAFRQGRHLLLFETMDNAGVVFRCGFDDWRGTVQLDVVDVVDSLSMTTPSLADAKPAEDLG
ncbi:single-stranded-DNA-specific exonuclease RecJ [Candidatus Bipolaricaulota bacterium]|nr:single-stranded-DNA-specific exonuclease RecJ [Candidatus Bipolaricaulota bacterium]